MRVEFSAQVGRDPSFTIIAESAMEEAILTLVFPSNPEKRLVLGGVSSSAGTELRKTSFTFSVCSEPAGRPRPSDKRARDEDPEAGGLPI